MIKLNKPLITCVLVTSGRVELVKRAIRCYLNQTYDKKHLVVLSQGSESNNVLLKHHINGLGRSDIHFQYAPSTLSLGEMRNTSVELSQGDVICQWDDDDVYHPDRLRTQWKALQSNSSNTSSCYSQFLKLFSHTNELYWCDWIGEPKPTHKYLCGTVMFHKRAFHHFGLFYPIVGYQSHVEEDLNVLEKLLHLGDIAPVTAGHQYVYVFHGANTYDLDHHNLTLDTRWGKKLLTTAELVPRRSLIEETLACAELSNSVLVRSPTELAYEILKAT